MMCQHVSIKKFLDWRYGSASLTLTGDGWTFSVEPYAKLPEAYQGIQGMFAWLLALENRALTGDFENSE